MSDTAEKMGLQGGGVATGVSGSGQITTSNATAANAGATQGAIYASAGGISTAGAVQSQLGFGVGVLPGAAEPLRLDISTNAGIDGKINNSNAGAGALSEFIASNGTHNMQLVEFGTGFTTSGGNIQDGGQISSNGVGGITVAATSAAGGVFFYSGGIANQRGQISSAGVWTLGPTSNPTANTFAPPVIYGRNNAAADNAGAIGETITSTVSGVAMGSTTITANVTSISPTAGKWLMWGMVVFHGGSTGFTSGSTLQASVGVTTGGTGTSGQNMVQESVLVLLASGLFALTLMPFVANISATTAQFLTAVGAYIAGSPTVDGTIFAERIA